MNVWYKILVILLINTFILAQNNKPDIFFKGSWEELKAKAKKDTIPFFVDFYAEWCAPCKIMDETFSTDTIRQYLKGKYLAYRVDVSTKFGKKLARKYRAMGLPMIAFFDDQGKLMGRYIGYLYAHEFILLGDKYLKKFQKRLHKRIEKSKKRKK